MPYAMSIWPDEQIEPPREDDLFRVVHVEEMQDIRWGQCVHVELVPVTAGAMSRQYAGCKRALRRALTELSKYKEKQEEKQK